MASPAKAMRRLVIVYEESIVCASQANCVGIVVDDLLDNIVSESTINELP